MRRIQKKRLGKIYDTDLGLWLLNVFRSKQRGDKHNKLRTQIPLCITDPPFHHLIPPIATLYYLITLPTLSVVTLAKNRPFDLTESELGLSKPNPRDK